MAVRAQHHPEISTTLVRPWSWDAAPRATMTEGERFQAVAVVDAPIECLPELQGLRRRYPDRPIVIRVRGGDRTRLLRAGREAVWIGCSAVVSADDDIRVALVQLCDAGYLLPRMARWLTQTGVCSPQDAALIEGAFWRWKDHSTVTGMLRGVAPARTVRYRLSRAGLPSPKKWLVLLRSLTTLLEAQMGGEFDEAALVKWCDERVGVPFSVVRGAVGWEAVVAAWLGSQAGEPVGHSSNNYQQWSR